MHTEIVQGIDAVDKQAWAAITAGSPYASSEWFSYGEAVLGEPGRYVFVREGSDIVGAAAYSLYRREQSPSDNGVVTWLLERFLSRNPLLVCRTAPNTNHRGIFLSPLHKPQHPQILKALIDAAYEIGAAAHASFILWDYLEADDLKLPWQKATPLPEFLEMGMRLDMEFDTFEAFLTDMKKRRKRAYKNYGQHMRGSEAQGMTVRFTHDMTESELTEALSLFRSGEQRYNMYPLPYAAEVMRCANQMPNTVAMMGCIEGRMVAFELLLFDLATRTCTPVLFGRDPSIEYSYFYMYYEEIRYCIETLKARTIIGNSHVYDFKERLGFTPDARHNLVFYPTSAVWRGISKVLMKVLRFN